MISIEAFQPTSLSLGDTREGPRGGCYTPLLVNGKPTSFRVDGKEAMRVPFGVSPSYSGGETLTMAVVPTPEMETMAEKVDTVLPALVVPRSVHLFGERKSLVDLKSMYKPLVHVSKSADYSNTVHLKIRPSTQIDVATLDGFVRGSADDIVRNSRVLAIVRVGSLWVQEQTSFGVTLEAVRLLVYTPPPGQCVEDAFPVRPAHVFASAN